MSKKQNKEKKKRGFLGYLWIIFLFFILIIVLAAVGFYIKPVYSTGLVLEVYSKQLANTLTSPKYYVTDQKDKIAKKREEVKTVFMDFTKKYKANPKKDWLSPLKKLDKSLQAIFKDKKITQKELNNFLKQVKESTAKL